MRNFVIATVGVALGFLMAPWQVTAGENSPCSDPGPFPKQDAAVAVDKMPEMFSEVAPVYPDAERAKKVEGVVWVKALVDKCGMVQEAKVSKSSKVAALDEAAVTAARKCEYLPAESGGAPVACWVTYKVEFRLWDSAASETKVAPEEKIAPEEQLAPGEKMPGPDEFVPVEVMPEMVYQERPVYPETARLSKTTGVVWIKALVDRQGKVRETMVGKTCGSPELDSAALDASRKCAFKPAIQNSQPVACWVTYKVEFRLDGN